MFLYISYTTLLANANSSRVSNQTSCNSRRIWQGKSQTTSQEERQRCENQKRPFSYSIKQFAAHLPKMFVPLRDFRCVCQAQRDAWNEGYLRMQASIFFLNQIFLTLNFVFHFNKTYQQILILERSFSNLKTVLPIFYLYGEKMNVENSFLVGAHFF